MGQPGPGGEGGVAALRRRKPPGGVAKLSARQRAQLPELLARGLAACGCAGELWPRPRVARVIGPEFGVSYHLSRVGRIWKDCGGSWQQPVRRASQRNEAAIRDWREARFPELKKGRSRREDHLVG